MMIVAQVTPAVDSAITGEFTLTLPHALRQGETAWLLVEVGALNGEQVQLRTAEGRLLGMISPYGKGAREAGGTYMVPLAAELIREGRVVVRVSVTASGNGAGGVERTPALNEVKGIRLVVRKGG